MNHFEMKAKYHLDYTDKTGIATLTTPTESSRCSMEHMFVTLEWVNGFLRRTNLECISDAHLLIGNGGGSAYTKFRFPLSEAGRDNIGRIVSSPKSLRYRYRRSSGNMDVETDIPVGSCSIRSALRVLHMTLELMQEAELTTLNRETFVTRYDAVGPNTVFRFPIGPNLGEYPLDYYLLCQS